METPGWWGSSSTCSASTSLTLATLWHFPLSYCSFQWRSLATCFLWLNLVASTTTTPLTWLSTRLFRYKRENIAAMKNAIWGRISSYSVCSRFFSWNSVGQAKAWGDNGQLLHRLSHFIVTFTSTKSNQNKGNGVQGCVSRLSCPSVTILMIQCPFLFIYALYLHHLHISGHSVMHLFIICSVVIYGHSSIPDQWKAIDNFCLYFIWCQPRHHQKFQGFPWLSFTTFSSPPSCDCWRSCCHCHCKEWGRRSRGATVRLESLGEVILFLFLFARD